jgi:type II secretory pathway component GspD/PulD (secretin)
MRTLLLALALALPAAPLAAQPPPGAPRTVKLFALKNADAEKLRAIVLNIFGRQGVGATADPRTNALIVTGDADTLEEVRKLIAKLDEPAAPKK